MSELNDGLKRIHKKMAGVPEAEVLAALGISVELKPPATVTGTVATAITLEARLS